MIEGGRTIPSRESHINFLSAVGHCIIRKRWNSGGSEATLLGMSMADEECTRKKCDETRANTGSGQSRLIARHYTTLLRNPRDATPGSPKRAWVSLTSPLCSSLVSDMQCRCHFCLSLHQHETIFAETRLTLMLAKPFLGLWLLRM